MSLSEYSSAPFSPRGHARKLVSVQLGETYEPSTAQKAILQLRDFFASRADLIDKDAVLSTFDGFISNEIPERRPAEIFRAALTRKHRKVARALGFVVCYQGPYAPQA